MRDRFKPNSLGVLLPERFLITSMSTPIPPSDAFYIPDTGNSPLMSSSTCGPFLRSESPPSSDLGNFRTAAPPLVVPGLPHYNIPEPLYDRDWRDSHTAWRALAEASQGELVRAKNPAYMWLYAEKNRLE